MLTYPHIDPIAFSLGPVKVHWYGIMYLVGFALAWWLGMQRIKRPHSQWTRQQFGDLLFFGILGVIAGGRLGYILFYDFAAFIDNPLRLFRVWEGGMSFHGGLLGVIVAMWWYGRRHHKRFFEVADFVAPLCPLALGAGRIGNFINGELWGSVSNVPWAMRVSCLDPRFSRYCETGSSGGFSQPMHPSMLYEALLEGLVLFLLLWFYSRRPRPLMAVSGLFLVGYGTFRFLVEFVRTPDVQLGYLAWGWVTMGQVLSLPMILAGVMLMWLAYSRSPAPSSSEKS
jgi:phosphatidylglycerol:prolipoprotein diacylglycerol transferase